MFIYCRLCYIHALLLHLHTNPDFDCFHRNRELNGEQSCMDIHNGFDESSVPQKEVDEIVSQTQEETRDVMTGKRQIDSEEPLSGHNVDSDLEGY